MDTSRFSAEEIEKMREFVFEHDRSNRAENREFDLNNPPKKPYIHQPWPLTVYNHAKRTNKIVKNAEELAVAMKAGFVKDAIIGIGEKSTEPKLDAAERAEVKAAQALQKAKR